MYVISLQFLLTDTFYVFLLLISVILVILNKGQPFSLLTYRFTWKNELRPIFKLLLSRPTHLTQNNVLITAFNLCLTVVVGN